jgi:hypothetical protein
MKSTCVIAALILSLLLFAYFLFACAKAQAQGTPSDQPSEQVTIKDIEKVLDNLHVWNVWELERKLKDFRGELTLVVTVRLESLQREFYHKDWLLCKICRDALRRANPEKYKIDAQTLKLEEMFAQMKDTKVNLEHYDHLAADAAAVGSTAYDFCLEMLNYVGIQTIMSGGFVVTEEPDCYRVRVAIKTLALLKDKRAIPRLKELASKGGDKEHASEAIVAVVEIEPTAEQADLAAETIASGKSSDQWVFPRELSGSSVPAELKLRIYDHLLNLPGMELWRENCCGVLRILSEMGSHDALALIEKELLKPSPNSGYAARELAKHKEYDSRATIVRALKERYKGVKYCDQDILLAVAALECKDAAPFLKERFAALSDKDIDGLRQRVLISGTLCALNCNYDTHANVVRVALANDNLSDYAFEVVGFLHDDETVKIVCSFLNGKKARIAAEKLGQMGNVKAWEPLLQLFIKAPEPEVIRVIGKALPMIAEKSGDDKMKGLAAAVNRMSLFFWDRLVQIHGQVGCVRQGEVYEEDLKTTAAFVKRYPELVVNLIKKYNDSSPSSPKYVDLGYLLAENAWNDAYIPIIEELIKNDQYHFGESKHYCRRRQFAWLLTRMTGKEHTYIDADGETRKPTEYPP